MECHMIMMMKKLEYTANEIRKTNFQIIEI